MNKFSLTLKFAGICTHFKNVVAGVPHRVVLPDCSEFRTGLLTVAGETPEPVRYYIVPHFASLAMARPRDTNLSIPGLIADGYLQQGIRIQVINAVDEEMSYRGHTRSVTEFMPNYNFASDVVLDGRAACYVDLHGGTLTTYRHCEGAIWVSAQLETDGPPELLVTPLRPNGPARSHRLRLCAEDAPREVVLQVRNLEEDSERPAANDLEVYDYLLHFLTARGGIPTAIDRPTPGMPPQLRSATAEEIGRALTMLGSVLEARISDVPSAALRRIPILEDDLTPSCSDSQYP